MQLSLSCGSLIQIATVLCLYSACCHGSESLLVKTVKTIHLSKAPVKIPAPHVKPVGFKHVRTGANHGHHGNLNHNHRPPPKTLPHPPPKTLPHPPPKTLPHPPPKTLPHPPPKTLPHPPPKTLPHPPPKTPPHAPSKTIPGGPAKIPAVGKTDANVKKYPQNDHGPGKKHDSGAQAVHTDALVERQRGKTEIVNPHTHKMDPPHHSNGNGGHNNNNQPSPPVGNSEAVANDKHTYKKTKGKQLSGQKGEDGKIINNHKPAPGTEPKRAANPPNSNQAGHANNGQSANGHRGTVDGERNSQNPTSQGGLSVGDVNAFTGFANNNNNGNGNGNIYNSSVIQPAGSVVAQKGASGSGTQSDLNSQPPNNNNSYQRNNNDGSDNGDNTNSGNTGNGKGQKSNSETPSLAVANDFANNINNHNNHHNTYNYNNNKKVAA